MRRWDQTTGADRRRHQGHGVRQTIALEDGVKVKLDLADPDGRVRTGDWWVFAARAATASVEELNAVPPRGVRHHYARLAIVRQRQGHRDCRVVFPGECECEGGDCDCTVCVTPGSHADDDGAAHDPEGDRPGLARRRPRLPRRGDLPASPPAADQQRARV